MLKNYVTNFTDFKLCIKIMCISYDIPKIKTRDKKKKSEKESWKEEESQLNRSLICDPPATVLDTGASL
jgi:hypothetical protein